SDVCVNIARFTRVDPLRRTRNGDRTAYANAMPFPRLQVAPPNKAAPPLSLRSAPRTGASEARHNGLVQKVESSKIEIRQSILDDRFSRIDSRSVELLKCVYHAIHGPRGTIV